MAARRLERAGAAVPLAVWLAVLLVGGAGACESRKGETAGTSTGTGEREKGEGEGEKAEGQGQKGGPRAEELAVDGVKLGDRFGQLYRRAPYNKPCDDDPVDEEPRTRRALAYGGMPCRGSAFPDSTTAIFVVDWAEKDDYDRPIRAIGWMGGDYLAARSTFPLRVGQPVVRATELLGKPVWKQKISEILPLAAWKFHGDVYVLVDRDRLAGVVLGAMPDDPLRDDWRVYDQMYRKFTRPAGAAPAQP